MTLLAAYIHCMAGMQHQIVFHLKTDHSPVNNVIGVAIDEAGCNSAVHNHFLIDTAIDNALQDWQLPSKVSA